MYVIYNNLQDEPFGILRESDGAWIPMDPANSDYQAYLNKDNPDWNKQPTL